jgi:type IV pilus assembly protein PilC
MNAAGQVTTGTMVAQDESGLADMLGAKGLFLTEARKIAGNPTEARKVAGNPLPSAARAAESEKAVRFPGKVKLGELSIFNEQFAIMIRSSLPILEALTTLARQQENPSFKSTLMDVAKCVRGGHTLAAAFARHPGAFDDVYISLLAAGEVSGKMPEMLDRLCEYINFQIRIRDKAISTLIYPSLVLSASATAILFLVVFILPTFMEIFNEFHMQLPLGTRILLWVSGFVRAWWHVILIGAAVSGYAAWKTLTSPRNAKAVQGLIMDVPVIGSVVRNIAMTRVFKTLSSLAASGIPILKAIELARNSAGNQVFAEALDRVHRSASEGHGLSAPMSSMPFPDIVGGMIGTGEKTGALPEVLVKLAAYYENQTNNSIQRFFAVLEPLFVAILGLMVGGIAFSVLIPVFSLTQGF